MSKIINGIYQHSYMNEDELGNGTDSGLNKDREIIFSLDFSPSNIGVDSIPLAFSPTFYIEYQGNYYRRNILTWEAYKTLESSSVGGTFAYTYIGQYNVIDDLTVPIQNATWAINSNKILISRYDSIGVDMQNIFNEMHNGTIITIKSDTRLLFARILNVEVINTELYKINLINDTYLINSFDSNQPIQTSISISFQSTNFITTNTSQLTLTGDKSTSGIWQFNEGIVIGSNKSISSSNAHIQFNSNGNWLSFIAPNSQLNVNNGTINSLTKNINLAITDILNNPLYTFTANSAGIGLGNVDTYINVVDDAINIIGNYVNIDSVNTTIESDNINVISTLIDIDSNQLKLKLGSGNNDNKFLKNIGSNFSEWHNITKNDIQGLNDDLYKIKIDSLDSTSSFLFDKISNGVGISRTISGADNTNKRLNLSLDIDVTDDLSLSYVGNTILLGLSDTATSTFDFTYIFKGYVESIDVNTALVNTGEFKVWNDVGDPEKYIVISNLTTDSNNLSTYLDKLDVGSIIKIKHSMNNSYFMVEVLSKTFITDRYIITLNYPNGNPILVDSTLVVDDTYNFEADFIQQVITNHDELDNRNLPDAHNIDSITNLRSELDNRIIKNSDITPNTGVKIQYDVKGLVVGSSNLVASDIPNLDASKITSGILNVINGGTGRSSFTANTYLYAVNSTTISERNAAQLLSDIDASPSNHNHDLVYLQLNNINTLTFGNGFIAGSYSPLSASTININSAYNGFTNYYTQTQINTYLDGKQNVNPFLNSLTSLATFGIMVKISNDNVITRQLDSSNGITITNNTGISSNPNISFDTTWGDNRYQVKNTFLNNLLAISGNGFIKKTGTDTFIIDTNTYVTNTELITNYYNKIEVDNKLQGLNPKNSVKVATTENITLSNTQTIDNISLSINDRVLVKNQSTQSHNGIYIVQSGSWIRADDANSSDELKSAFVFVEQGTINADTGWVQTADNITLGTSSITFVQFSGSGSYQAKNLFLDSLSTSFGNGIVVKNGSTAISRTIQGLLGIQVTNGDGISGNPTISLPTGSANRYLGWNGTEWESRQVSLSDISGFNSLSTGSGLIGDSYNGSTNRTWVIDSNYSGFNNYYTITQVNTILNDKADINHNHNLIYLRLDAIHNLTFGEGFSAGSYSPTVASTININPSYNGFINYYIKTDVDALLSNKQDTNLLLTSLLSVGSNGIIIKNNNNIITRQLDSGNGISIINNDGISGNPNISFDTTWGDNRYQVKNTFLNNLLAISGNGFIKKTGIDTFTIDANTYTTEAYITTNYYNKTEVDNKLQGLNPKNSVRVATATNITLSGTQTIDGIVLVVNDRVLVKNQSTQSQNGIYIVQSGSWIRSDDANSSDELKSAFVFVEQGTINADTGWVQTADSITLGTSSITFVQFSGSGSYQAKNLFLDSLSTSFGNGIVVKNGNTAISRTIQGLLGIQVTNGDGIISNPTISLPTGSANRYLGWNGTEWESKQVSISDITGINSLTFGNGFNTGSYSPISISTIDIDNTYTGFTNYYTKTQVDDTLSGKANSIHSHTELVAGLYNNVDNTPYDIPRNGLKIDWYRRDVGDHTTLIRFGAYSDLSGGWWGLSFKYASGKMALLKGLSGSIWGEEQNIATESWINTNFYTQTQVNNLLDGKQNVNPLLTSLSSLASFGIVVRSSGDNIITRQLDSSNGITIINNSGITGNPTISFDTSWGDNRYQQITTKLNNLLAISGNGFIKKTGTDTFNIDNNTYVTNTELITNYYNKTEVDNKLQGLNPKNSVKVATISNITLSGAQTIDGIVLIVNDRVLVKNQSTQSQNGIYIIQSGAWIRSDDANSSDELKSAFVFVEQGTINADTGWVQTADNITLGTSSITFVQFSGSGSYQAKNLFLDSLSTSFGNGIVVKNGNTAISRTIQGLLGIIVTNGDGVSSNPTISLPTGSANRYLGWNTSNNQWESKQVSISDISGINTLDLQQVTNNGAVTTNNITIPNATELTHALNIQTANGIYFNQGLMQTYTGNSSFGNIAVPWNAPSGIYGQNRAGLDTQIVIHFNSGGLSARSLQFKAHYSNGGLWYASSRDALGFVSATDTTPINYSKIWTDWDFQIDDFVTLNTNQTINSIKTFIKNPIIQYSSILGNDTDVPNLTIRNSSTISGSGSSYNVSYLSVNAGSNNVITRLITSNGDNIYSNIGGYVGTITDHDFSIIRNQSVVAKFSNNVINLDTLRVNITSAATSNSTTTGALVVTGDIGVNKITANQFTVFNGNSTQFLRADGTIQVLSGAISNIFTDNLTGNRATITDTNGKIIVSNVTNTELSYVSGVTSSIQTQINNKQSNIPSGTTSQYYRGDKTWQTLNTTIVTEGTNQYFTQTRSRQSISLSIVGTSGPSTYDNGTGVLTIPDYTSGASNWQELGIGNAKYLEQKQSIPVRLGVGRGSSLITNEISGNILGTDSTALEWNLPGSDINITFTAINNRSDTLILRGNLNSGDGVATIGYGGKITDDNTSSLNNIVISYWSKTIIDTVIVSGNFNINKNIYVRTLRLIKNINVIATNGAKLYYEKIDNNGYMIQGSIENTYWDSSTPNENLNIDINNYNNPYESLSLNGDPMNYINNGLFTFNDTYSGIYKWVGGVLAPNGKIYAIPYNHDSILEIDPISKTSYLFGNFNSQGTNKWVGGILAPNGKIYAIPENATQILEIDPLTHETNLFGNLSGVGKWYGAVLAPNGNIYFVPSNSDSVLELNPYTNNINLHSVPSGSYKWYGGVLGKNGKLYFIPGNRTSIMEYDTSNNTYAEFGNFVGDSKWITAGVGLNGKIYATPYLSNNILEIDVDTRDTKLIGDFSLYGTNKFAGTVCSTNGKIYLIPYDANTIVEFDPYDYKIINYGNLGNNIAKYAGANIAYDGNIYCIPYSENKLLQITPRSTGNNWWVLSNYVNKY